MVRVKNGLQRHARHKKFIARAKGYQLWRWNVYKQVRLALVKAGQHSYVDRKLKKRTMRSLWIERLSAACQSHGTKYSTFIHSMTDKKVILNRKVLSNIAIAFPQVFDEIHSFVTK